MRVKYNILFFVTEPGLCVNASTQIYLIEINICYSTVYSEFLNHDKSSLLTINEVTRGYCFQPSVFVYSQGNNQCSHYPWYLGPHHTGTSPKPCPLSLQVPPGPGSVAPLYRACMLGLETCSNLFTWEPLLVPTSGGWLLKHIRCDSGRYSSCRNAFFLIKAFSFSDSGDFHKWFSLNCLTKSWQIQTCNLF